MRLPTKKIFCPRGNYSFSPLGLHQDEWKNTAKLLYEYGKKPGNIVKVLCEDDDDQTVNLIYIQLAEQRKMFQKYGEVAQLDGSYSVRF